MGLLCTEAAKLGLPRLKTEIIETAVLRGPAQTFAVLPCIHDEAEQLKVLYENPPALGATLDRPCPECDSEVTRGDDRSRTATALTYDWKMLQAKAEVCDVHTKDKRYFDKARKELKDKYKNILVDFNDQLINGMGNVSGAESTHLMGVEGFIDYIKSNYYDDVEIFATDDGTATGTPQPLSLPWIRRLQSVARCVGKQAVLMSGIDAFNAAQDLIESTQGNTAEHLMAEMFGQPVAADGRYNGFDWIVNDHVGRELTASYTGTFKYTAAGGSGSTVTIDSGNYAWPGLSDRDIGRTVEFQTAAGVATDVYAASVTTAKISSVTNPFVFVIDETFDTDPVAAEYKLVIKKTDRIYAIIFDEEDGFAWRHPDANGSTSFSEGGRCLPTVCGMREMYVGPLQDNPTRHRWWVQMYGEFYNGSVDSVAVLSHFDYSL